MIFKHSKFFIFSIILFAASNVLADGEEPWEGAYTSGPFAGGVIRDVYCDMVGLLEGTMGGLLFAVAGLVAIAMGVFGEGGQSKNILVVAIGALTTSVLVSLYFGDLCGGGAATRVAAKNAIVSDQGEVLQEDASTELSTGGEQGELF